MEQILIDANALLETMKHSGRPSYMLVQEAPTIEARPVVHGRWIAVKVPNEWDKGQCSVCKSIFSSSVWGTKYCPNCGARMDGGDGNSNMA